MVRHSRGLLWTVAACMPLAMPCRADVIRATPADALPTAVAKQPADNEADEPTADEPADMVADEPAPVAVDETPAAADDQPAAPDNSNEAEVIQERYPNRAVKIERQVVQDASGNYVNHGKWTMYDEKGRTLARGEYRYGERQGPWTRWHLGGGKDMFSQAPYKQFQAPFVTEVTFENGRLSGAWTIYDNRDRKCSEFNFEHGERQGKSTWYYPNGSKMRELDFTAGQLDGHWLEWGTAKNLTMNDTYQNGQRLAKKIETHANGQTKSEGTYLFAREVLSTNYDWWNGTVTTTAQKEGKDQKHGLCTTWYKNGQKETEGQYVNDVPVGHVTWWHENGQKAVEGQYANGDRIGSWTWWHQNGQKAVSGDFVKGVEIGKWTWWKEDGKVANSARITEGQSSLAADASISIDSTLTVSPTAPPTAPAAKPAVRQARVPRRAPAPTTRR
jgi:antitoxin component YwqK of YwqJK toxin-antitoxin module